MALDGVQTESSMSLEHLKNVYNYKIAHFGRYSMLQMLTTMHARQSRSIQYTSIIVCQSGTNCCNVYKCSIEVFIHVEFNNDLVLEYIHSAQKNCSILSIEPRDYFQRDYSWDTRIRVSHGQKVSFESNAGEMWYGANS